LVHAILGIQAPLESSAHGLPGSHGPEEEWHGRSYQLTNG
jgi:hypothetical protein